MVKRQRSVFVRRIVVLACASAVFLAARPPAQAGILAAANLSVTKTRTTPSPIHPGGFISYDITVTNNGPEAATNVVLTDVVPSFTTVDEGGGPAGWLCTVPPAGSTGTMTCSIASLPAGTSAGPFNLQLNVDNGDAFPIEIDNTATVSSDTPDPDPSDNSSTAATALTPLPPPAGVPTLSAAVLAALAGAVALSGLLVLRR